MNSSWPQFSLGNLLNRAKDVVEILDDVIYKQVTIRLWNKGVILRSSAFGSEIKTKRQFKVRSGQLVLSRIDVRNGAIGLVPQDLDSAIVSNDFWVYNIDQDKVHPQFLTLSVTTPAFWEKANRTSSGTTKRIRAEEDAFLRIEIPLPPLSEQRRIVAKIEQLAAKIEEARGLRNTNNENAEALFISKRAQIVAGALKIGKRAITEVADLERGKFSHRPRNEPRFFGGKHPWIQIGEIEAANKYIRSWSHTLNDEGLSISKKFPKGTLLISIAATIGAVGILDFDCCIPDSIVGITPKRNTESEFLYHYLGYLRTHLEELAPQSAQKNINLRILSELPFPQIGVDEQRRIVAYLDGLQAQVDRLKILQAQTAAELEALLPSILDRAFKGEL